MYQSPRYKELLALRDPKFINIPTDWMKTHVFFLVIHWCLLWIIKTCITWNIDLGQDGWVSFKGLGVNHYRDNHYQWPPLPHDNQYQWQSVPHDNHHHMTTINMPCTINTCHHYHVLFCKKIITTWQSPPHDNHHHMTITTTYLQMSPNYNCVRPGDSFIWFDLYRYSLSKPTIVVISKEYWKVFITFIIV